MSLSTEPTQMREPDALPSPPSTSTSAGTTNPAMQPSLAEAIKRQRARHAEVAVASWLRELGSRQR